MRSEDAPGQSPDQLSNMAEHYISVPEVRILAETQENLSVMYDGKIYDVYKSPNFVASAEKLKGVKGARSARGRNTHFVREGVRDEIKSAAGQVLPAEAERAPLAVEMRTSCVVDNGSNGDNDSSNSVPEKFYEPMIFHILREKEYKRVGFKDAEQRAMNDELLYALKYFNGEERAAYLKLISSSDFKPLLQGKSQRVLEQEEMVRKSPRAKRLLDAGFENDYANGCFTRGTDLVRVGLRNDCYYISYQFALSREMTEIFWRVKQGKNFFGYKEGEFDKLLETYGWLKEYFESWYPLFVKEMELYRVNKNGKGEYALIDYDSCAGIGSDEKKKFFGMKVIPRGKPILEVMISPMSREERKEIMNNIEGLKVPPGMAEASYFCGEIEFEMNQMDKLLACAEKIRAYLARVCRG